MPALDDNRIEAAARAMLRERIEATPWFWHGMTREQRQEAIERDVDTYWHLFIADAAKQLLEPTDEDGPSKSRALLCSHLCRATE